MANLRRATQDNRPQAPFLPTDIPPPTSPLDFPLILLVTYNNYMPVSTHTWPFKWATPRKLATPCWFSSLSLSLFLSWPKTFLWLRHIKAKKYRMSFVCLSFSPFFTLSIFAWAQLTRFCYYFDCETINFCDKRPLMAWRQSFAIFSQFADTTTICV